MFPEITLGHLLYVAIWALLGIVVSAVAWSQSKMPTYKDFLAGTLGISFEALGVELARGKQALILPLALGLLLATFVRYLPEDEAFIRAYVGRRRLEGRTVSRLIFVSYFFTQILVLLLSYRGWWDIIIDWTFDNKRQ